MGKTGIALILIAFALSAIDAAESSGHVIELVGTAIVLLIVGLNLLLSGIEVD